MRVLIVDDSVVFRSQIKSALDGIDDIVVVNTAANGKIGIERLQQNEVDVVILDLEMPVMDGKQMLQEMRKNNLNQKVIVFASPTGEGIDLTLSALEAGASDFITKPNSNGSLEQALEGIKKELVPKILQFKNKNHFKTPVPIKKSYEPVKVQEIIPNKNFSIFRPKCIGIGSSTGGPNALEHVLAKLKGLSLEIPIFLAQHMPPKFTEALARRLEEVSGHPCHEGKEGQLALPGHIYVAPGDYHMTVEKFGDNAQTMIRLDQGSKRNSVRPAVDNLFESLAKVYGNSCVAFVLTGMGEDGLVGAHAIKAASGSVIIQDAASSVVWGMPGAIFDAGAYDAIGNLDECSEYLVQLIH
ncbi:chemotaxis-specific protein-glutamate methyltransferase CheB [Silvanigrella aquatica]|uniref:Protein-glutamate methylesterase/protein-glutamine glutaminase n=1 Tax=Silvanigrella aquatica TaxID=1915309 RepID=A0A1L4CYU4_9BACT|nr:chemotaxis-specific protein-glutamate methyltransferase CheB [Silvanigrella aquatica]APJ03133.1 hypothetical protein AXG55_04115 [Silvanigrella aquatica]